jgi:inorganic pyrophosphatase
MSNFFKLPTFSDDGDLHVCGRNPTRQPRAKSAY